MPPKSWFDRFDKKDKKKMSEADKLLSDVGYHKDRVESPYLYRGADDLIILFRPTLKTVEKFSAYGENDNTDITMQELKAIYKKCEELGWF